MRKNRWFIHLNFLLLILLGFVSERSPAQSKTSPTVEKESTTAAAYSPLNEAELNSERRQLFKLLRISPRLTTALSVDPSLLSYQDYVSHHNPELARFLESHPGIARNPEFYLFAHLQGPGGNRDILFQREVWPESRVQYPSPIEHDLIPFCVFVIVVIAILWLSRFILQNRRWGRIFKAQTDMHAKLLDRFGSAQELSAYLETDAGRKFLDMSPIQGAIDFPRQGLLSPITRILAPLQLGIVSTLGGIGLLYIRTKLNDSGALLLIGTIGVMVGVGFILSAGISWLIAQRLGLIAKIKPGNGHPETIS